STAHTYVLALHDALPISGRAFSLAKFAADEKRLQGGSLIKSAEMEMKKGRSLTAAVGWCAPSEVIYNLCDLASLDGILDLPEIQDRKSTRLNSSHVKISY